MEPYEGAEPYIFISYARKDAERAAPLLEALSGAGYRVWYDAGIRAGADWLDTLLEKVERCAVFCPLYSEAFNASQNCLDETKWARHNKRTIVPVYLEAVDKDRLQRFYRFLETRQDLRLYQYESAAQFVERLAGESAFEPCKVPEWHKIGEIQWRLGADGVLKIAKNEDMNWGTNSIPAYQFDPVHGNTAPWVPYREKILSVEIADDIKAIGDFAFWSFSRLTKVFIGDSVTKIGHDAFIHCANLIDVRIPNSVTVIGAHAFTHCESLMDVLIPDSVTEIGEDAFAYCYSLTDMYIPDSVNKIGDEAFLNCTRLTNVRIPDSVIEIGNSTFEYCKSLTNVRIPDGVSKIGDMAFAGCYNLTDVRIPDSVTQIGSFAFHGCENLKRLEIPAGAEIDEEAFSARTFVTRREASR